MTIEINDRLYKEFGVWAKANGMDDKAMTKYIESAFREKFTLDKYGDLNKKVHNNVKPSNEPNHEPINEPINEPIPEIGTDERINEQIKDEPPKRKSKVLVSK